MRESRKNAQELEELIVMEQLLSSTTPDLRTWLKHEPKSVTQLGYFGRHLQAL